MKKKNGIFKYERIERDIKDRIGKGELRPGDLVKSEAEMVQQFQVSKMTVKTAMNRLADEGVVVRIQGKGTFVAPCAKR
ncbi:GntR family transcriptional regulator [Cohnella hongkongensis]|uniref:GntR family transcriptional regulator n=1 Tax=Cohnella hongkongensis TaxID=178337 RepID=A0ABV9FJM0_9BACL